MAALKVGVVGLRYGKGQCVGLGKCAKTDLVAVCDLKRDILKEMRKTYPGVKTYEQTKDMLRDPDIEAVVCALPAPLHYPITCAALKAGKHVLCEKPPASTAAQTRAMVDLARRKGLTLAWGIQRRFLPEMHAARKALRDGMIGNVHCVMGEYVLARTPILKTDKFRMRREGGGVFFDLGVHALDMAWSLLGCPKATRVVAAHHTVFPQWYKATPKNDMAEDTSKSILFFDGGAIVTLDIAYCSQRDDPTVHQVRLRLLGDKGGLSTPSMVYTHGGFEQAKQKTLKLQKSWRVDLRQQLFKNFAGACRGDNELLMKSEEGIELMKMLEAVIKSANQEREVRIK